MKVRTLLIGASLALIAIGPSFGADKPAPKKPPAKVAAVKGEDVYKKNCAGCHGDNGEGKSGPALAGKKLKAAAVEKMVTGGKPPKMPAFGKKLKAAEIKAVADYVSKLK